MKFIENIVEAKLTSKLEGINKLIKSEVDTCKLELELVNRKIYELNKSLIQSKEEILLEITTIKRDIRNTNTRCDTNSSDLEIGLDGIIKLFNDKFESLGSKKSIVTDLLKKIAKLEDKNVLT